MQMRVASNHQGELRAGASMKIPTGGKLALTAGYQATNPFENLPDYGGNLWLGFPQPLLRGAGPGIATPI